MKRFMSGATGRLAVLIAFTVTCLGVLVYFVSGTEIRVPLLEEERPYTMSLVLTDIDNLVPAGDVRIAGVQVGEVRSVEPAPAGVLVGFELISDAVPLHEGVVVRVGEKSLVGETYLEIEDGDGAELPAGTVLPPSSGRSSVQLYDLLASLDQETLDSLGSSIDSLAVGTADTRAQTAELVAGLGRLGREGHTALDAIAAQSEDLTELARQTTTVLAALDTGNGQIADLVGGANRLTEATAGQRTSLEETVRLLPGTLDSARTATGDLQEIAVALSPVAGDLRSAAPMLAQALQQLPDVSGDLRGLLPALDGTLQQAPATLDRVPTFGEDVRDLVPGSQSLLSDAVPMLAYLKPYGPDIASWVTNFNSVLQYTDEEGHHYARMQPIVNEGLPELPVEGPSLNLQENPIPESGRGGFPGPTGNYPRIEAAPR